MDCQWVLARWAPRQRREMPRCSPTPCSQFELRLPCLTSWARGESTRTRVCVNFTVLGAHRAGAVWDNLTSHANGMVPFWGRRHTPGSPDNASLDEHDCQPFCLGPNCSSRVKTMT